MKTASVLGAALVLLAAPALAQYGGGAQNAGGPLGSYARRAGIDYGYGGPYGGYAYGPYYGGYGVPAYLGRTGLRWLPRLLRRPGHPRGALVLSAADLSAVRARLSALVANAARRDGKTPPDGPRSELRARLP